MTFLPDFCAVGTFENIQRKSARIYRFKVFFLLSDKNWKYFWESNWDVSPVLSLHCCIVYSDGLPQTKDNINTVLSQSSTRIDIWQDKIFISFLELEMAEFHYSRPQKMCALWSKTNYGFYLLTFNHYLFRASEGKWEIGFVGICSSCSN